MPAKAKGRTSASVEAFVLYWVDVFNYATSTGDTKLLKSTSSPRCISCTSLAKRIDDIYQAGGRTEGRGWSVQRIEVQDPGHVEALIKVWPQVAVVSANAEPQQSPATKVTLSIGLDLVKGRWLMLALDQR